MNTNLTVLSPSLFPYLVSLIASAVMCGAWWYAAVGKRRVGIFFWLAATHTFSFGLGAVQLLFILTHAPAERGAVLQPLRMFTSIALAALYVALVRWLIDRPDEP